MLLFGTVACNESKPKKVTRERESGPLPSWFSPKFYTNFDITTIDSVIVSYTVNGYSDSQNLGPIAIHDKKLDTSNNLWSFEVEESVCTCNDYYFNLKNETDSIIYNFSVKHSDTSVLLDESKSLDTLLKKMKRREGITPNNQNRAKENARDISSVSE